MADDFVPGYRPTADAQVARTDMHCHSCSKAFIVELDFTREGNHVIKCPHCDHAHYRAIRQGKITEERWNPGLERVDVTSVWKTEGPVLIPGSTAAQFIRDSWLNARGNS